MGVKLSKLDRRMNGYGSFKYVAKMNRNGPGTALFKEIRNWCWEQWGPSCELELHKDTDNPLYCWKMDEFELRVYLATDKEASWFHLKWS